MTRDGARCSMLRELEQVIALSTKRSCENMFETKKKSIKKDLPGE